MNNIRAIEALNQRELEAGVPLSASWHTDWSDTAYVFIGGLPYELSEGDIITIFSQFGEPVHVNLVRDKDTGKSKGFAFLKYEDQRSTNLAVDNLGGATILGRIIRVDHTRYKPKEGEVVDENAHANAGTRAKNEDDQVRPVKRRRGDGSSEDESGRIIKAPSREMLKEELELQKLIREHDEDDPMKEYLIREKKEEVQKALEKIGTDHTDIGAGLESLLGAIGLGQQIADILRKQLRRPVVHGTMLGRHIEIGLVIRIGSETEIYEGNGVMIGKEGI